MRISSVGKRLAVLAGAVVVVLAALVAPGGTQQTESTWERVKRTGVLKNGVFDYPPYWVRDKASGQWKGAMIEMAEDIAKELGVKLENVEIGGWAQVVLALQAGKTDMQFSLQATPKRATAIDFAGPIYHITWVTVNNKNFKGRTWTDYNKPDVKVAVMAGSADEVILRKMAPKATRLQMAEFSQVVLAVTSGRAQAFTTTVLASLTAKQKNPDLGDFVFPTPTIALPGYIGLRQDPGDYRFQKFLHAWAEWNTILGHNEDRMKRSLGLMGIEKIPEEIRF